MARIALNALVIYTGATYRNAGVSRYATRLIEALLRAGGGHEYDVWLNDSVRKAPFATAGHTRLRRTRLPTARTSIRILWEQLAAPALTIRRRADLIHSFLNVTPLAAPARQVVTVHDLSFRRVPDAHPAPRRWYLSLATWASTRRASRILADSKATKHDLVADFGVDPGKIVVVYPGADPGFHPRGADEVRAFRATHGLQRPFVIFVGTLEPRKNVDVVIQAFARIRQSGAFDGELVIAGGAGWGGVDATRLAATHGVSRDVRVEGYVKQSDLPLWYTSADLAVYPSSYEGFGIPVLEAMASGTPVITSNRSSLPEVVGDAGPTVDPRDDQHLSAVMIEILTSSERRGAMRARGLSRAQQFRWSTAAERCLDTYRHALSRS